MVIFIRGLPKALYTLIFMYMCSVVVEKVICGFNVNSIKLKNKCEKQLNELFY